MGYSEKFLYHYSLRQVKYVENAKYLKLFQMHVAIVEQFGGEGARDPVIVIRELEIMGVTQTSATDAQILEARRVGEEKCLAMALI
jgi:hypothetical protein